MPIEKSIDYIGHVMGEDWHWVIFVKEYPMVVDFAEQVKQAGVIRMAIGKTLK